MELSTMIKSVDHTTSEKNQKKYALYMASDNTLHKVYLVKGQFYTYIIRVVSSFILFSQRRRGTVGRGK